MRYESSQLREYMEQSGKTVAVTGAGISYLYGMRRLKQSVGLMNSRQVLSPSFVRSNPDDFYKIVKTSFLDATFEKGPSEVHKQLATLEKHGLLYGIVTQNMDCLHTIAGSKNVVEFQGSFGDNICVDCGARYLNYKIWNHGHTPTCEKCGSPLMPTTFCRENKISEQVSKESMKKAQEMISEADLVIIIGTTGFRSDEYLKKMRKDTKLVQINPSETPLDSVADWNIHADAAEVLGEVMDGWEKCENVL
ncbi:MAG: hypothetical protein LUH56_06560 [Oscillospiraceae bacterium]|nr:hypothetical protein [Oscillospiraceae bacterium]